MVIPLSLKQTNVCKPNETPVACFERPLKRCLINQTQDYNCIAVGSSLYRRRVWYDADKSIDLTITSLDCSIMCSHSALL